MAWQYASLFCCWWCNFALCLKGKVTSQMKVGQELTWEIVGIYHCMPSQRVLCLLQCDASHVDPCRGRKQKATDCD